MSYMYNKANYDNNIYNCLHFVFFLLSCATLISTPVELILLIPLMSGIHTNDVLIRFICIISFQAMCFIVL